MNAIFKIYSLIDYSLSNLLLQHSTQILVVPSLPLLVITSSFKSQGWMNPWRFEYNHLGNGSPHKDKTPAPKPETLFWNGYFQRICTSGPIHPSLIKFFVIRYTKVSISVINWVVVPAVSVNVCQHVCHLVLVMMNLGRGSSRSMSWLRSWLKYRESVTHWGYEVNRVAIRYVLTSEGV